MYCNYSKDKFGNELTFIIPSWLDIPESVYDCYEDEPDIEAFRTYAIDADNKCFYGTSSKDICLFIKALDNVEQCYLELIKVGWKPQQARQVLPNALKTELVVTGFVSDWQHFFRLRTSIIAETGKPHPDASALADPLYKDFIARGYMESLV